MSTKSTPTIDKLRITPNQTLLAEEGTEVVSERDVATQIEGGREKKGKKDIFRIFTDSFKENPRIVLDIQEADLLNFFSNRMRFDGEVIKLARSSGLFENFFNFRAIVINSNAYREDSERVIINIISGLLGSFLSRVENLNTEFTEKRKKRETVNSRFGNIFNDKLNEKFLDIEVRAGVVGMSFEFTHLTEALTDAFIEAYKQAKKEAGEELDISEFVQAFLSYFEKSVFCKNYKAEYRISKVDLLTRLTLKAATAK